MKPKLKYFLTSFIGAMAIAYVGTQLIDKCEGPSVLSALVLAGLITAAIVGWISLMAKLILR